MSTQLLCTKCLETNNHIVWARIEGLTLVFHGRHYGNRHLEVLGLLDLLPPAGTQEYADLVAELVRRLPILH